MQPAIYQLKHPLAYPCPTKHSRLLGYHFGHAMSIGRNTCQGGMVAVAKILGQGRPYQAVKIVNFCHNALISNLHTLIQGYATTLQIYTKISNPSPITQNIAGLPQKNSAAIGIFLLTLPIATGYAPHNTNAMKRFAFIALMMLSVLSANAVPVHYFTRSQAHRAASFLTRQAELMIYCGYDYELPTYVLLNEAWAEPVNATYYELWLYGYDAYTGEEVMMPVDLQCVWLQHGGDIYNAAQHLHFRTTNLHTPPFAWAIPEYLPYVRTPHPHDYTRTYHYTVHTYGWMPPAYTAPHPAAAPQMHPYYMRPPSHPAPRPTEAWQPGSSRPHIVAPDPTGHTPTRRTTTTATPRVIQ